MAIDKTIPGLQPVRYFVDFTHRLSWVKVPNVEEYWMVTHKGEHVGEMFLGKTGWIGIVFGRGSFSCARRGDVMRHIAGIVINKNH